MVPEELYLQHGNMGGPGPSLLPVTVCKELLLFFDKDLTNHHHPRLQAIG